jgi:HK97 family phage major capsid protein
MESWQEKADKARHLIETIKRDKEAVENAEDAIKLQRMFDDAQRLAGEAASERSAVERHRLETLIDAHDKQSELRATYEAALDSHKIVRPSSQPFALPGAVGPTVTLAERMHQDKVRMMASDRCINSMPILQQAALSEGTVGSGGYLVVPQYLQELFAETRRQGNALRAYGWLNVHPVESNQIYIPRGSGAATVGIVSENTPKPSADQTFTQIAVSIFTAAGISKQSKQLAQDSSPTVLDLSTRELGTLLGNLEEQKIISGTGTGEPRGILATTGLAIAPQSSSDTAAGATGDGTATTAQIIIDKILDGVVAITTSYFGPPNGVLMHPRRLGYLLKGKDAATYGNYLFNVQGTFRAPDFGPAVNQVTSASTGRTAPQVSLFGLPLATSTNIPTTAAYGSSGSADQDVIIVGAWQEAHYFQRQDVTLDTTDIAGTSWEQNQIWVRAEERFGFTAERYPSAWAVIHGKGLKGANS